MSLIRQGASGYLNKECEPKEIVEAIRTISLGRRYITPGVAELLARQLDRKTDAAPHEQLSEREFQVFLKLATGETAGAIAEHLSQPVDGEDEPGFQQRPDLLRVEEPVDQLRVRAFAAWRSAATCRAVRKKRRRLVPHFCG
jgi:hypothetical protein